MGNAQQNSRRVIGARVESLCKAYVPFQVRYEVTVVELVMVKLEKRKVFAPPVNCQVDVQTVAKIV